MEYVLFRASEILDMAIRIEEYGVEFYKACLEFIQGPKVKEIFNYFIEQEKNHINIFTQMRKDLPDRSLSEAYPGEMRDYVDGLVRNQVFYEPKKASQEVRKLENQAQALEFGIEFEERSILFYSAIKEVLPVRPEGETLDKVIAEEHNHIRQFLMLRREIQHRQSQ
jgi:rubrerythrin